MRFRIFYKFLLLIVLFALLPLIWLGINLINKSQFSLKTPISELHIRNVDLIKKSFILEIEKYDFITEQINSFFITTGDWDIRQKFLTATINSNKNIISISLLNLKGEEFIKASKLDNDKLQKIDKKTIDELKDKKKIIKFEDDKLRLFYNNGNYVVNIDLDKKMLISDIGFESIGEESIVFAVDSNNNIIASSSQKNEQYNNDFLNKILDLKLIRSYINDKIDGSIEINMEKDKFLGAISTINFANLHIISLQNASDAFSYAMSLKSEGIKILFVFGVVVISLSYFLSRGLSKPIIKFIDAAKKVANKDFSVRINIKTRDDLEDLADTFNLMVEELDKYSKIQLEKILRERQNTQAVMYSTDEGIVMVDLDYNIQLINRKAVSIMELSGDLEGKNIFDLIDDGPVKNSIKSAMESENKHSEIEIDYKNYKRFYRVFINEIKMANTNDIIGWLITFFDITYDKELEKIKEDFLHSITHDLRNPISAIKGFSEFLLKEIAGTLNQNQKNMVISIDRAAFRLLQMVNNILDIAKMEAGKIELNLSKFNVVELVRKAIDLMSPLAAKKNIKFEIEGIDSIEITADQNLIERVYINLIGNAIKFTPQDGKITVGFHTQNGNFISWVEDTGEGIPLEYIDKVFSKFEQVKGQKAGGTGLGLTICKHIIEAHLGKIWAEYREKMGAKFVFSFPLNLSKDEFGRVAKS